MYDSPDPMGKCFFNILATFAEFEVDLLRMRTREGVCDGGASAARPGLRARGLRRPEFPRSMRASKSGTVCPNIVAGCEAPGAELGSSGSARAGASDLASAANASRIATPTGVWTDDT